MTMKVSSAPRCWQHCVCALVLAAGPVWPAPTEANPVASAKTQRGQAFGLTPFAGPRERRLSIAKRLIRTPRQPADTELGFQLLRFDALQDYAAAQFELGDLSARPGPPLNTRLAGLRWLTRAELAGHPTAAARWKHHTEKLPSLARRLALAQADSIRRADKLQRARLRISANDALKPAATVSQTTPLQELQAQANAGELWAQTALGHALRTTPATQEDGLTWWFFAASRGDRMAMRNLAESLTSPQTAPPQPTLAFAYWCLAYDQAPAVALSHYPDARLLPKDAVEQSSTMIQRWRSQQMGQTSSAHAQERLP